MNEVNTWVVDPRDGVCIGGKYLHYNSHNSQTMTNTELSLDQLSEIAGGGILKKLKKILKDVGSSGPFNPTEPIPTRPYNPIPVDEDPGENPGEGMRLF